MRHVVKILEFDAAHRLLGYNGLCANLHGHRYRVELKFAVPDLDELGIGLDFSSIKRIAKSWIDDNWDHALLLNAGDSLYAYFSDTTDVDNEGQRMYMFDDNPTAEVMAEELYHMLVQEFSGYPNAILDSVTVWETPTSSATYSL